MNKPEYYVYRGLSYEQASREAARLVEDSWFKNFERLTVLHAVMEQARIDEHHQSHRCRVCGSTLRRT